MAQMEAEECTLWTLQQRLDEGEVAYYERLAGNRAGGPDIAGADSLNRFELLETENSNLKKSVAELVSRISKLEARVTSLEGGKSGAKQAPPKAPQKAPEPQTNGGDDDDDDIDLFGSDDNDNGEADKAREKRLQDYAAKKAKKPGPIAKSSVVLDVKPWDDETDLKEMEKVVRSIQMDGLVWGASKFQPIAYNIKKLQIVCVVEDEKVGIEDLSEKIQEFEDYVQSVDIAAFNKI